MGKGDKKTKRGKIILGSSGIKRPKNKKKILPSIVAQKPIKKEVAEPKPAKKEKVETAEVKPVAKKTTAKKAKEAPATE